MRKDMFSCDVCNKVTENYYKEEGWIIITGENKSITKTTGLREGANTFKTIYYNSSDDLHFCSEECLIKFINTDKK